MANQFDDIKQVESLNRHLVEKWSPILDDDSEAKITDFRRKAITAWCIENTVNEMTQMARSGQRVQSLMEDAPTSNISGGGVATYDPVLISLVRRSMPNLIAHDLAGVQPMNMPTGLIFAMKSRYTDMSGTEALFNEADTDFSGTGTHAGNDPTAGGFTTGTAMTTAAAEALGDGIGADFNEMSFSIEKVSVEAKSRALKASYSIELAQDLRSVHGLDAETELANILSAEILTEINREIIRRLYTVAKAGAQFGVTTAGTFDLDTDANGRWMAEKHKGLLFQCDIESNTIAKETRRNRGNWIVCSSNVASALALAGKLDYAPALGNSLDVNDAGNTFAGVLNGKWKVYIDPYFGGYTSGRELLVVGYKGSSPFDAGFFYCPYVPLQMLRSVGTNTFNPNIGFKTRYGIVGNPFYGSTPGAMTANANPYFRRVLVTNLT